MIKKLTANLVIILSTFSFTTFGQIDEDVMGAWYMFFLNTRFNNSQLGFQGDIQYRNWNLAGDLEQLFLRGAVTYRPDCTRIVFALGYGHITTGVFGESKEAISEERFYQEILMPHKVGTRFYLVHRFRFEERFVDNQDFRTRWVYNLFLNIPLNRKKIQPGAIYIALYNELYINCQREIGHGFKVEIFDRNFTYGAIGYVLKRGMKVQAGIMRQVTNIIRKKQLQLSVHVDI